MATFAFDYIEIKAELFGTDGRYDVEAASTGDDFSVLRSSKVVEGRRVEIEPHAPIEKHARSDAHSGGRAGFSTCSRG
jgi:hypothetical protein